MKHTPQALIQAGEALRFQTTPTVAKECGVQPPQAPPTDILLADPFNLLGGGPSRVSGISAGLPNQSQRLGTTLPTGGGGGGGPGGAGGRGGSRPCGGGSSSNSTSLGAGSSPNMDLPAMIRSAVEESIAAATQGVAAVTTAAVEARSAADDHG